MCGKKSFTLWVLQILGLLGLLVFFLWLSLRPKKPTYTITEFSTSTSLVNQGGNNGTVSFELEIQNPNKDSSIYYDDTLLTFSYWEDTLGEKTIPSFHQKRGRTSQIFNHVNPEPRVWKKLAGAISNATAELKVAVVTKIRYRMWGRTSKHHGIDLRGTLWIGSNGQISGKKKKIRLHTNYKKWKKVSHTLT